jgi:hypothetical protein
VLLNYDEKCSSLQRETKAPVDTQRPLILIPSSFRVPARLAAALLRRLASARCLTTCAFVKGDLLRFLPGAGEVTGDAVGVTGYNFGQSVHWYPDVLEES